MQNNTKKIIRNLRKRQNLTLSQLAQKVGVNTSSLSRIERGELNVNITLLQKLANALNTSPQVFFEETLIHHHGLGLTNPFIQHFRLAAKFINQFNKKIFVIALGGDVINDKQFSHIAHDINLLHSLNVNIVLVHGIRPQIDHLLKLHKNKTQLVRNQRVTDKEALGHIIDTNGRIRINIESILSSSMIDSPMAGSEIKLSSGNFLTARPLGVIDGIDMQHTGQIRKVDTKAITNKLQNNEIVIVSPIGFSPIGEIFNLSYEQVAAQVARSIKANKLIYYVNDNGILNARGDLIPEMSSNKAENLIYAIENKSSPETAPYISYNDFNILKSSLYAIKNKIEKVHLINRHINGSLIEELYTDKGSGTILTEFPLEIIRQATSKDTKRIHQLIEPLGQKEVLVHKALDQIEGDILNFYVIEHNHNLIGCVALYPYEKMIEVGCFAIDSNYQNQGYGSKLLKFCEKEVQKLNGNSIFILTTQSEHWFLEKGFQLNNKDLIPSAREKNYEVERNSKFFTKKL